jgi:branched-chain amino acid transport system permease protein
MKMKTGGKGLDFLSLIQCLGDPGCLINQTISALIFAMLLFLIASGLSLIFGVLGVMNFAHGSLYMLGAYLGYTLYTGTSSFSLAVVLGCIGVGIFGIFFERVFIKRVYGQHILYQLLLTYAFILILDDVAKLIWGYEFITLGAPDAFRRPPISLAGSFIPTYYMFVICVGILVVVLLWLFLWKTKYGKLIRATAHSNEMVMALGRNTTLIYAIVFGLGALLAGLGGVLAAPIRSIFPGMGSDVVVDCFIVVVVGGMGSIPGAFLAAIVVGFMRAFGMIGFPLIEEALIFILMAVVLIVRPQGFFGRAEL